MKYYTLKKSIQTTFPNILFNETKFDKAVNLKHCQWQFQDSVTGKVSAIFRICFKMDENYPTEIVGIHEHFSLRDIKLREIYKHIETILKLERL